MGVPAVRDGGNLGGGGMIEEVEGTAFGEEMILTDVQSVGVAVGVREENFFHAARNSDSGLRSQ